MKKDKTKDKTKAFFKDFKTFVYRGNIINLAIAVTVGAAFGAIVTSLVNDIITPFIALIFGKDSFSDLRWVLNKHAIEKGAEKGIEVAEIAMRYGAFIQTILNFFVIAFVIFVIFRFLTKATKSLKAAAAKNKETEPEAPPAPPAPTQEELLTQIRDLLAEGREQMTNDKGQGTNDVLKE